MNSKSWNIKWWNHPIMWLMTIYPPVFLFAIYKYEKFPIILRQSSLMIFIMVVFITGIAIGANHEAVRNFLNR